MPQAETQVTTTLEQWRGMNQRVSPTLVQSGFFFMARGTYFGLGENCTRLPGKKLSGLMPAGVFSITTMGEIAIVQLQDRVVTMTVKELAAFDISFITVSPVVAGSDQVIDSSSNRIVV